MNHFCIIHINSTLNNTILTATNLNKNFLGVKSLGNVLKSNRGKRSVSYGALLAAEALAEELIGKKYTDCQILVKGFGGGRESAIQGLAIKGLQISDIIDITRVPHNGCRPPKRRRI
jgi:small subunit ribosomal protein S11